MNTATNRPIRLMLADDHQILRFHTHHAREPGNDEGLALT